MIPNAKIDALLKEPPTNVSSNPNKPPDVFELPLASSAKVFGLIPGNTICVPTI